MYLYIVYTCNGASQVAGVVRNPPANAGDVRDMGPIPGLGRSPGEGYGHPLSVFLPGESQEEPDGLYSPWGHKESDTTEATGHTHTHTHTKHFHECVHVCVCTGVCFPPERNICPKEEYKGTFGEYFLGKVLTWWIFYSQTFLR